MTWRDGGRTRWWQWPWRAISAFLQGARAGRDEMEWLREHDPDEYLRRDAW